MDNEINFVNKRLLSKQEIDCLPDFETVTICKVQLAKADKWWVEMIEANKLWAGQISITSKKWQQLKKEIGI